MLDFRHPTHSGYLVLNKHVDKTGRRGGDQLRTSIKYKSHFWPSLIGGEDLRVDNVSPGERGL